MSSTPVRSAAPRGRQDGQFDTSHLLEPGTESRRIYGKRFFDISIGLLLMLLLSPLFIIITILILVCDYGPVFYRPSRVGRNEVIFRQNKFRTMVTNADQVGAWYTSANDERVTWIGRRLRITSLDEIPQLFNVVRGEMSLVGPRPAAPAQMGCYTVDQRAIRAKVRPGITGLAQVSGRSDLDLARTIELDLEYCRKANLLFDLSILARTIAVVIARRGTN